MITLRKKILPLLGIVVAVLATILVLNRQSESNDISGLTFIFVLVVIALILLGNFVVTRILNRLMPWHIYRIRRFVLQLILSLSVSLFCINQAYIILKNLYTDAPARIEQLIIINIYGAAIIIPIISLYFGTKFLMAWNNSQIETERWKKENARSQMQSLRNHLDPHFLFNNLNILSSLMDYDLDLSKEYLVKFAEVYRTILKSELSDLTTLGEERKLIEAYIFLMQIRWKDSLHVALNIKETDFEKALPPLSGQMLLENAIKHNTISQSNPLTIEVRSTNDGFLEIKNTKHIKAYQDNDRKGTGLTNISNRYAYFTDKEVIIEDKEDYFSVKLPLLEIEPIAE